MKYSDGPMDVKFRGLCITVAPSGYSWDQLDFLDYAADLDSVDSTGLSGSFHEEILHAFTNV